MYLKNTIWAGKMAQCVIVLAAKLKIMRIHLMEENLSYKLSSDLPVCHGARARTHTHPP